MPVVTELVVASGPVSADVFECLLLTRYLSACFMAFNYFNTLTLGGNYHCYHILQMWKWRHREFKELVRSHLAC